MELEDMFTKMKKFFILCIVMAMCSPDNTNAQSFFKKIKKAVEKELKATSNENQSSKESNAAGQQSTDETLKGLFHGNFGTDGSKKTLVEIHETSATKRIILDKASGIRCGEFLAVWLLSIPLKMVLFILTSKETMFFPYLTRIYTTRRL